MRTLVFEAAGEYAQFKKPYSPMSPVSYPFPPPVTVLGMLGAIAGYPKDEYHESLGWKDIRIAVALCAPLRVVSAAINLLNTKDGTDPWFRPRAGKNTHIQIPYEFLKAPRYRIYVANLRESAADAVAEQLSAGSTFYTVSLGLASCLADLRWVGEWNALPWHSGPWQCVTATPLVPGMQIHYEDRRRYHRLRVPAVMDSQRVVHRYQEVVVAEDGEPVSGIGGHSALYTVADETIAFL